MGSASDTLERSIHDILHPNVHFAYADFCAAAGIAPESTPLSGRWLNAKCDVQAMWSHINAANDVFVTEDKRFLTPDRRAALIALGAGSILTPNEAVVHLLISRMQPLM